MALFTADPKRLADFYGATFDLKPVGNTDRGSIFVSDGYFNQALLYQRVREEKNGFNHFGFKIRDVEETRDRAEKAGVRRGAARPQRIPFAEFRAARSRRQRHRHFSQRLYAGGVAAQLSNESSLFIPRSSPR